MAPRWPEEVDVFSVPHSRMKKLVHKYSKMITSTDFRDEFHLTTLLQNLINVFSEFKAHEQIENTFIMRKLRSKLQAASITNPAVCNCHSDNRLTEMLDLVVDGYKWTQKTERERQVYGRKLRHALEDFTQNFIPHMEEEEEVFQPMLMQYFSYEELKELKKKVIHQHDVSKQQGESSHEKFVEDSLESDNLVQETAEKECNFSKLPAEVCLQILSYLGPKDLLRAGQVCHHWHGLSRDPLLWSKLYPVHWAQGNWTFFPEPVGGVDGVGPPMPDMLKDDEEQGVYMCLDEDADVDESGDSDAADNLDSEIYKQILKEAKMITAMVKYLLPHVGSDVKVCDLAYSRGISSSMVHKILKLCPNLEMLDLTHTKVGDAAFREYGVSGRQSKLRHLDLTGCENITDVTLISLVSAGRGCPLRRQDSFVERDEDKDQDGVDIENVPPPCRQRLSSCCVKEGNCEVSVMNDVGAGISNESSNGGSRQCCKSVRGSHQTQTPASVDVSQGSGISESELPEQATVNLCDDGVRPSHGQHRSPHNGDPNFCDLSYVYTAIMIESEETNCRLIEDESRNCGTDAGCGLVEEFTNISLSPEEDCFDTFCDIDDSLGDFPLEGPASSAPQRTCGERRDMGPRSSSQTPCCRALVSNTLGAESFPPQETNVEGSLLEKNDNIVEAGQLRVETKDYTQLSVSDLSLCPLEFLSLNGCYRISDNGLDALAEGQGTPYLRHLDLSGCVAVSGYSLARLVTTCSQLDHSNLFYCDNISDDPFPTTASGCRNLQCDSRFCCSFRE